MPSPSELIVCGLFFFISLFICSYLLPGSLSDYCKKKRKMQPNIKRTVGMSLISMSLFTFSLFLYVVHLIIFVAAGTDVQALELLNNLVYLIAVLMALYVWIRRLSDTFQNSSNGYSAKFMRNLRLFYFVTLGLGLALVLLQILANLLNFSRMGTIIGGAIFALAFVGLFITVLALFIHKMNQIIKLAEQVAQNTVTQTHTNMGDKLVQLIVKFTVLAVVCISSSLISWVIAICILAFGHAVGYWAQLPLVIDDFVGFMSLYCAWTRNKVMYRKVFGCLHTTIIQLREEPSVASQDSNDAVRKTAPSVVSIASQSNLETVVSPDSVSP
eukprot:201641_1